MKCVNKCIGLDLPNVQTNQDAILHVGSEKKLSVIT